MAERHQIAQQLFPVNFGAAILDLHRTPVRLVGDQAVGLQQMADQRLFHNLPACRIFQVPGAELVVIHLDILIVDAGAVKMGDRLPFQFIQAIQRNGHVALGAGA